MKLQEVYLLKSAKGITLFEIIITIAIFTLLIAFLSSSVIDFYQEREFNVHFKSIVQSLRRAQLQSIAGKENLLLVFTLGPVTIFYLKEILMLSGMWLLMRFLNYHLIF